MTDLEATRLCAQAMGYRLERMAESEKWRLRDSDGDVVAGLGAGWKYLVSYDPLHDDAQAMALIKRFGVATYIVHGGNWTADMPELARSVANQSLNAAIVYCVAQMQDSKESGKHGS